MKSNKNIRPVVEGQNKGLYYLYPFFDSSQKWTVRKGKCAVIFNSNSLILYQRGSHKILEAQVVSLCPTVDFASMDLTSHHVFLYNSSLKHCNKKHIPLSIYSALHSNYIWSWTISHIFQSPMYSSHKHRKTKKFNELHSQKNLSFFIFTPPLSSKKHNLKKSDNVSPKGF